VVHATSYRRSPLSQPAHTADVAQARLFMQLLQSEADELEQLIMLAETRWLARCERGESQHHRPPDSLARFRERLAEVQKLKENLRTRFLHD
jgi:hypothetical protein